MKERLDRMTWEIFQIERDDSPSAKGCKNENWKIIEYYSQAIQHRIPDTCLRENGADSGVLQMPLRRMFITNQTNNYYSTEQNHYLHYKPCTGQSISKPAPGRSSCATGPEKVAKICKNWYFTVEPRLLDSWVERWSPLPNSQGERNNPINTAWT